MARRMDTAVLDVRHLQLESFQSNLSELIQAIQYKINIVKARKNRIRNESNAIVNLPVEILARIFAVACSPSGREREQGQPFELCRQEARGIQYAITATCSRWADVVRNFGILWRFRRVARKVYTDADATINMIRAVEVSHIIRLEIDITGTLNSNADKARLTKVLESALPRAEYLASYPCRNGTSNAPMAALYGLGSLIPFPHLKKLSLHLQEDWPNTLDLSLAPLLSEVYLRSSEPQSSKSIRLILHSNSQLQRMILNGTGVSNCFEALQSYSALKTLSLYTSAAFEQLDYTIDLPSLKTFIIIQSPASPGYLIPLDNIHCPKLETLRLSVRGLDRFQKPLHYHSLKTLALHYISHPRVGLDLLIPVISSLEHVECLRRGFTHLVSDSGRTMANQISKGGAFCASQPQ